MSGYLKSYLFDSLLIFDRFHSKFKLHKMKASCTFTFSFCFSFPSELLSSRLLQYFSSPALRPYNKRENAKYRDQKGATFSRIAKD